MRHQTAESSKISKLESDDSLWPLYDLGLSDTISFLDHPEKGLSVVGLVTLGERWHILWDGQDELYDKITALPEELVVADVPSDRIDRYLRERQDINYYKIEKWVTGVRNIDHHDPEWKLQSIAQSLAEEYNRDYVIQVYF